MVVELYPHQREAVNQLSNGKVLWGGVGTGKTITSLVYFYEKVCGGVVGDLNSIKTPMNLYVITTAKKRDSFDWQEDAAKLSITGKAEASVSGITITVDSWQNIKKYVDVENAFFIFDEQRVVGSNTWYKSFIKIAKSNRWVLLSATPGDTWLDYIALFVANGFVKNRTEFKRNHCVYSYYGRYPKLERYLETGKLVKWRNQLLVEMPYKRHTTRHIHDVSVDYDKDLWEMVVKKRWHVYENRPLRDVSELFSVMRKVVNSDASRLQAVRELMNTHPKVIVFYNFDYELDQLRTLVPEGQLASPESILDLKRRMDSQPTSTHPSTRSGSNDTTTSKRSSRLEKNSSMSSDPSRTIDGNGSRNSLSGTSLKKGEFSESVLMGESTIPTTLNSFGKMSQKAQDASRNSTESLSKPCESSLETLVEQKPGLVTDNLGVVTDSHVPTKRNVSGDESWMKQKFDESSEKRFGPESSKGTRKHSNTSSQETQDGLSDRKMSSASSGCSGLLDTKKSSSKAGLTDFDSTPLTVAEWNGHKHEPIPKTDRWVYLVQYRAGAEGWNCVETDTIVFYSLTYSYKDFHQAHGRIDRLNTPFSDLHYYNFVSKSQIDRAIMKALKEKRNFNESGYVKNF